MDIGVPFRDLGPVDMAALAEKTLTQEPRAWHEHELRQRKYDVHHDTHSIVLIFCDARWPDPTVAREPGWTRLADVRPCPMKLGRAYEINNQKVHSVMNRGKDARISFIFDYFPPAARTA